MSDVTLTSTLNSWQQRALALLRIVAGVLFLEHGTMKLFNFPAGEGGAVKLSSFMGLTGALEVAGGILIVLGLFTRPTAFILSGMMAVAYWMAHAPRSMFPAINQGDAAILYCFLFLYLVFAGPGAWSLDGKPK